jgi:hypothetical protein
LNSLARQIWEWCLLRGISFFAIHLPGRLNGIADFHSRHFSDSSDWKLATGVVKSLLDHWPGAQFDLFASRTNNQLPRYFSWRPDPGATAIDAIAQSWLHLFGYAFPPFALIGRVLCKMRQDRAELILIAPWWPSQTWWPNLVESAIDLQIRIAPRSGLLLNAEGVEHPLTRDRSLILSAWRVSGDPGRIKDFRALLLSSSSPLGLPTLSASTMGHLRNGENGVWNMILMQSALQF